MAPFGDCAYIVGAAGTMLYYGSAWVSTSSGTTHDLYALSYLGPYFNQYAAVGADGTEVTGVPFGA